MPENNIDLWVEVIGWLGSIEILLAYGLNIYGKIKSNSIAFSVLNLTGGLFLIFYTVYKEAFASAFINLVWVIIALIALGKLLHENVTKNAGT
jgi:cation transport ATPase